MFFVGIDRYSAFSRPIFYEILFGPLQFILDKDQSLLPTFKTYMLNPIKADTSEVFTYIDYDIISALFSFSLSV